jgi:chromosome segregation ATPase
MDAWDKVHSRTATVAVDIDGDGIADVLVTGRDVDGDGIPDALQSSPRSRLSSVRDSYLTSTSTYVAPTAYTAPVTYTTPSAYTYTAPSAYTYTAPSAVVAVDVDGDGKADYIVAGVDRDGDGIPDALQGDYGASAAYVGVGNYGNYGNYGDHKYIDTQEVVELRRDVDELRRIREIAEAAEFRNQLAQKDEIIAAMKADIDKLMGERKGDADKLGMLSLRYQESIQSKSVGDYQIGDAFEKYKFETEAKIADLFAKYTAMANQNQILTEQHRDLASTCQGKDVTIQSLRNALVVAGAEASELAAKNNSLQVKCDEYLATIKALEGQVASLKHQLLVLQGKEGNEEEVARLKIEASGLRHEKDGLGGVIGAYKHETASKIDELNHKLNAALAEVEELGKRLRDREGDLATKDVTISSLQKALSLAQAESQEALIVVRAEAKVLEQEIGALRQREAVLDAELKSPRSKAIAMKEVQTSQMDAVLVAYKAETADKLAVLHHRFLEMKQRADELAARCARQEDVINALEYQLKEARMREVALQNEVDQLRKALHLSEAEKVHLREERDGIQAVFMLYQEESERKMAHLQHQYTALFGQFEPLKEKIRHLEALLGERDAQLAAWMNSMKLNVNEEQEALIHRLRLRIKELEDEVLGLRGAQAGYLGEIAMLKDELEKCRHRPDLEALIDELRRKIAFLEVEKKALFDEKNGIAHAFAIFRDETAVKIQALNQQYTEMLASCEGEREKVRKLEAIIHGLNKKVEALEAALAAARHEGEETKMMRGELAVARETIAALQTDLDKLRSLYEAEKRLIHTTVDPSFNDMGKILVEMKDDTAHKLYNLKYNEMKNQYEDICHKYQLLSDSALQQQSIARAEKACMQEELDALRHKCDQLQGQVDKLAVIASHVEIERKELEQEKAGMSGVYLMRNQEAEAKLKELNGQYSHMMVTCEALREKCRQLESNVAMRDVTISSLQGQLHGFHERLRGSTSMDDTKVELANLEHEMSNIASRGAAALQQLQVDVMRLQMDGKKLQERDIFLKIDAEFDRADANKDGKITRDEFDAAFGMKSPTRRQWQRMDPQGVGSVTREQFTSAIIAPSDEVTVTRLN